ncbi:ferritin-like domain-containing protein [Mucilaginibacter terrae]|uniref:ferritin-like domain-containing protein n=1 Tax=Mucilaginibacter terrae TaxID=1955052 RepID=UPI00362581CC
MNLLNLVSDIQTADPEFADRISPRRAAIKNITSFGSKVAVAALPFAFSTLFKKAYGQTATRSVADVLNLALTAELLEAGFYRTGLATTNLIASADRANFQIISNDENNHVTFLKSLLGSGVSATNATLGNTANTAAPTLVFDFAGNKGNPVNAPFPTVFTDYQIFLAVASTFEDFGVRAYKGQAGFLKGLQTELTVALNIHSVEARHASFLRRLRASYATGATTLKPWITADGNTATGLTGTGLAATTAAAVYSGEANTTQAGVNLTAIGTAAAVQESFDEPIDTVTAQTIVGLFVRA